MRSIRRVEKRVGWLQLAGSLALGLGVISSGAEVSLGQQTGEIARGIVFEDLDRDQLRGENEKGLSGIGVSNGREIVETDESGRYEIAVDDDDIVFVIKPRGYATPLTDSKTPVFYYIHKPAGSPDLKFPGVAPTGPLPESIDFPLTPVEEPDQFRAILFGDPQPRDQTEIDYIAHDVIEELVGTDASLGITLGDILFDDLSLFESQAATIALLGIPWYNVIGNHDINYDATDRRFANETFERHYGPSYYSFDHGPVHFVVLDDIDWIPAQGDTKGRYEAGLGAEQLSFVRADLERVPDQQLVVFLMHIPLTQIKDRQELYRLMEKRSFCISISGHTHHHEHRFVTREDGWQGPEPHHHIVNVTVSGSWWSGMTDERNVPHTTMADGAPNGYSIMTFDGVEYRLDFRAAGRSADYQMAITAPEAVESGKEAMVYANVFDGSERSVVEMRVGASQEWVTMTRSVEVDPAFQAVYEADLALTNRRRPALPKPKPSTHLWKASLPTDLPVGPQLIHIRTTDMHGRVFEAYRVFRVIEPVAASVTAPAPAGNTP